MGLRFNLNAANWVAHLIQPGGRVPEAEFGDAPPGIAERETLRVFLHQLGARFFSSPDSEYRFHERLRRAIDHLERCPRWNDEIRDEVLRELRAYFARRSWTALLIPSGRRQPIDRVLCSEGFLRHIVRIRPEDPGLVLQLEEAPQGGLLSDRCVSGFPHSIESLDAMARRSRVDATRRFSLPPASAYLRGSMRGGRSLDLFASGNLPWSRCRDISEPIPPSVSLHAATSRSGAARPSTQRPAYRLQRGESETPSCSTTCSERTR